MFEELGHEVRPVISGPAESQTSVQAPQNTSSLKQSLKRFIPSIIWHTLKDISLLRFDASLHENLRAQIEDFQPDFVYERVNYLQLSGIRVCKEMGIPHFSETNAPYLQEKIELEGKSLLGKFASNREKQQLEGTDKVFVVSTILKNFFIKKHQVNQGEEHIIVTPNGITVNNFRFDSEKVRKLKEELGLKPENVVVGFVGSIQLWHGVDLLVRDFHKIYQDFPHARLLVVGGGESLEDLKQMAVDLGIADKVFFVGKSPFKDVPIYVELMVITVMAKAYWFGSPLKIFEYAALDKAIIAPDFAPVREVMTPNVDGLIIDGEKETLENALRKLVESPELRIRLAENFHNKVLANYTWEKNAKVVLQEFEKLS